MNPALSALIELEDAVSVLLDLQEQARKTGKSAVKDRYMSAKLRRDIAVERARRVIKESGHKLERVSLQQRRDAAKKKIRA